MAAKPVVHLLGQDSNVFNLAGLTARALRQAGQGDKADEMMGRLMTCASYDAALQLFMEYADVR
jgi:hypothetical protein